ncbi:hypothetical protein ThidrDRAFT_4380 [Thiorhodococcus drewsii AZ1]|uniref:DUF4214 domain-containing protein n=2 Tax=Thiorhodococcus drewsii TaxID=210408 RepID=G2E7W6_9GAMM|nr:hypothetical protein ThidrDRAFT_4380 [Thiorhodococcus drewsii AZ1]
MSSKYLPLTEQHGHQHERATMMCNRFRIFSLLLLALAAPPGHFSIANDQVAVSTTPIRQHTSQPNRTLSITGSFGAVDLSNRELSRAFYNLVFLASENIPLEWAGDVDSCDAGTISTDFMDATLLRVNYFRAMAGVPSDVVLSAEGNLMAQQGALMLSANDELNHNPPSTWLCYTPDGAQALDDGSLSGGTNGPGSVYSAFRDNGDNNASTGHRYSTLLPTTTQLGTGDIPELGDHKERHVSYWVDRDHNAPWGILRDGFIAWPPPGFVPYPIVFPRWSLFYQDADFSAATVEMSKDRAAVPVVIDSRNNDYRQSIVWVPEGYDPGQYSQIWNRVEQDTTYSVVVRNVVIGGIARDLSYQVTIMDPADAGHEDLLDISGPDSVPFGATAAYRFSTLDWSDRYEIRTFSVTPMDYANGAEDSTDDIIDGTATDYPLLTAEVSASGNSAFHLAHPDYNEDQYFQLPGDYLIGVDSHLSFASRLGYASDAQVARAQISLDSGQTWVDLWSQAGTPGTDDPGETSFSSVSLSLEAYSDYVGQFRFFYDHLGQSGYNAKTKAGFGWYVDDVLLLDVEQLNDEDMSISDGKGEFSLDVDSQKDLCLQVRNAPWEGFDGLEWGPVKRVSVVGELPTRTTDWMVTEIYLATLGYAPDDEGLQYWVDNIAQNGWTPTRVAQSFFDQPSVQAMYPAEDGDLALIEALYHNLFAREPDTQGLSYWRGELESGRIRRNQMIIALVDGGWANAEAVEDMRRFGNRVEVGLAFAEEQAARGIVFSRLTAEDQERLRLIGQTLLADVTSDTATRDAAIASIGERLESLDL